MSSHQTVLLQEAITWLAPGPGGWWVDCTVGGGGHTEALLQATAPDGLVLGLDQDQEALEKARARLLPFGARVTLVQANFRELIEVAGSLGIGEVSGILMDLGVSSFQLDTAERGFSFQRQGPLDMRMDQRQLRTAAEIVNHASEKELADLFYTYGEERRSRPLARWIVKHRPVTLTSELAELARQAIGHGGKIHPATRMFQALRMVVNDELGSLRQGLQAAEKILRPGGRLVVISFHSLEDRVVKEAFKQGPWERLTKHVLRPQPAEVDANPRARSARLRAAAKAGGR